MTLFDKSRFVKLGAVASLAGTVVSLLSDTLILLSAEARCRLAGSLRNPLLDTSNSLSDLSLEIDLGSVDIELLWRSITCRLLSADTARGIFLI